MTADAHTAALQLVSGLVCPEGQLWGQRATSEAWEDVRAVLSDKGPRRFFYTRPRGGSKTEDAAAEALAWGIHLTKPGSRGYAFAASEAQASRFMEALSGFVWRTPALRGAVRLEQSKVTFVGNGSTFEVMSSDAAGAWGLRPDFIVVDELAAWRETSGPKELWTAILSAIPKVPGCRLVIITSAGSPKHFAYDVRRLAQRSRRWRVSEWSGPLPWRSAEDLEEERAAHLPSVYARLHLNVWIEAEDQLALRSDVEAAAKDARPRPLPYNPAHRYVISLDVGWSNDNTVITVAHAETPTPEPNTHPGGIYWKQRAARVVIDEQLVWKPPVNLEEAFEELEQVARRYDALVIADPVQTVDLVQRLLTKGFRAQHHHFNAANNGRLASVLHELLRNGRIDIPSDPELIDELCTVKLRETSPGVLRLDTEGSNRHDDRAVTIAMCAFYLLHVDLPDSSHQLMVQPQIPITAVETHARQLAAQGSGIAIRTVREFDQRRRPIPLGEYLAQQRRLAGLRR